MRQEVRKRSKFLLGLYYIFLVILVGHSFQRQREDKDNMYTDVLLFLCGVPILVMTLI